ncbi:MAG: phosphodiester glycosidase family protein [Myxococcales bacterium]|nr:phosphodiester glycosidase family protein [Myxococcales bacterium]
MGDKKPTRARRWLRRLGKAALVGLVLLGGLWFAIHRVRWLGPAIADGLRAVLGPGVVAWMEDTAYGIQDYVNRWRYEDEAPKTFWEAPTALPTEVPPSTPDAPRFSPPLVEAPFAEVATPSDGVWVPIADPSRPQAATVMFKTMVHPDPRRGFAALAVIAIDAKALDLHLMAGTHEPASQRVLRKDRPGIIPEAHYDVLVAAFNGGFKTTHGQYGMLIDGVELLPPRDIACTFAKKRDGHYTIRTFSSLGLPNDELEYYRQTPPCLVEEGEVHQTLDDQEYAKGWGATVSGDTVIRRSAIGVSEDGTTLYYGIGEAMTAQALARGMKAAGSHGAAQLDVNYSYPRFLFYERPDPEKAPIATRCIIPHVEFTKWHYVGQASPRDFFYLAYRSPQAKAASASEGRLATSSKP